MEKAEQRQWIQRLQAITNMRGDAEIEAVIEELKTAVGDFPKKRSTPKREETGGRDRQHTGGRSWVVGGE